MIDKVRPAAVRALAEHRAWLAARLAEDAEFAEPRIGPERFARKVTLTLDAVDDAGTILARAEADLERVSDQIAELAAELTASAAEQRPGLAGQQAGPRSSAAVRQVLDRLAGDAPDDSTILALCEDALAAQREFVGEHRIVSDYLDPVETIEMPEIDRGVAVAYCDPPGPLKYPAAPPSSRSPPPPRTGRRTGSPGSTASTTGTMVHNLMVHEAMPGHYLQLQHSRRFTGAQTAIRAALRSGSFVEGWAVYAERVMAEHGYPGGGDPRTVRMQQLEMQLRMIINAILDAGVHAHGMTQAQAMALMTERGYQEEGEAAGKWRRALLTSAQLSTYYVGYTEVSDLARALMTDRTATGPGACATSERDVHDAMLAHGSPPVRLLRTVLAAAP